MAANNAGASDEAQIYQHLAADGYSLPDIAGIMGNERVESGGDPAAYNPRENAIGLFQWEGGRKAQLDQLAAARGTSDTDLNTQLAYFDQEMAGPYATVAAKLRSTNDPAQAAAWFDVGPGGPNSGSGFENSSGSATGLRESFAQSIFAQLQAGQTPSGGPTGSAGGVAGVTAASFTAIPASIDWNPLNWPSDALGALGDAAGSATGKVAGGVLKVILPFATKAFFVVAGLGIVGLGLYRASEPAREKAGETVEKAAPLAAAAA